MGGHPSLKGTGLRTEQVALSTAVGLIRAANASRTFIEVKNMDASISIYVGPAGITTATGFLLKAGEAIGFEDFVGAIYGIAASSTPSVSIIEW